MSDLWPWLTLAALGAYHGINPAMGWLFAVALGLQEHRRAAVLHALLPITLGHLLSVALVVVLVGAVAVVADPRPLRVAGGIVLIGFGLFKFLRPRSHPKWVGFHVGPRELTVWSFLMSAAHGAGLMLFPVLPTVAAAEHAHHTPAGHTSTLDLAALSPLGDTAAVLVHALAMLLVMAVVALLVYEKLGVTVLRRAWINLELLWAGALVIGGLATLLT